MLRIILILIFLPWTLYHLDALSWTKSSENNISIEITLSNTTLSIDQMLEIVITCHFPKEYTLNVNQIRTHLLKYSGLSEPPFALVSEKVENITERDEKIFFKLEPQLAGTFFLSFYDIVFYPKNKQNAPVVIISPIFEINITLPPEEYIRGFTSPLLSLTKRYPVTISQNNRLNLLDSSDIQQREQKKNQSILQQKMIPWAPLSGILLFLFCLLIIRMQPKKSSYSEKSKIKIAITARKKALLFLKKIEDKKLPEKKEFDCYYTAITETVRTYIEERYKIKTVTQTVLIL